MAAAPATVAGLAVADTVAGMGLVHTGLTLPEAAAPEPGHTLPEIRLWLAVVCQAIVDASSRGTMPHQQVVRERPAAG